MVRCVWLETVLAALTVAAATAEMPPGYGPVISVTNDTSFSRMPSINSSGQIVFAKWVDPNDSDTSEIFLYDHGVTTRLTNDAIADDFPTINDAGVIVWSRWIGANGTAEIVRYDHGQLTRLTHDAASDWVPWINNQGAVCWYKQTGTGCHSADCSVWLYDGSSTHQLTDGSHADQIVRMNDLGDIVWTRYDMCNAPYWTSQIMMYSDGVITALTGDQDAVQNAVINDRREVAWLGEDAPDYHHHTHVWRNGVTTLLTDWGDVTRMNNRGDIAFNRWHDDTSTWQVCLYQNGAFYEITSTSFWSYDAALNDRGDLAWDSGTPMDTDLKAAYRRPPGDVNCDGLVDPFDIDAFISTLTNAQQYHALYPNCDYWLADVNLDGIVNPFDIDPFIAALMR